VKWFPTKSIVFNYAQPFSSFVNQLTQIGRSINYCLFFVYVFSFYIFFNLRVFPRSSKVKLAPSLKVLLGFNLRVKNPFSLFKGDVGFESSGPLIESLDLLSCEFSV